MGLKRPLPDQARIDPPTEAAREQQNQQHNQQLRNNILSTAAGTFQPQHTQFVELKNMIIRAAFWDAGRWGDAIRWGDAATRDVDPSVCMGRDQSCTRSSSNRTRQVLVQVASNSRLVSGRRIGGGMTSSRASERPPEELAPGASVGAATFREAARSTE